MKKEWSCKDVQEAYRNAGSDPKDVPKTHFGLGLLPCDTDCRSKMKITDSELQLRKSVVTQAIPDFLLNMLIYVIMSHLLFFWHQQICQSFGTAM